MKLNERNSGRKSLKSQKTFQMFRQIVQYAILFLLLNNKKCAKKQEEFGKIIGLAFNRLGGTYEELMP